MDRREEMYLSVILSSEKGIFSQKHNFNILIFLLTYHYQNFTPLFLEQLLTRRIVYTHTCQIHPWNICFPAVTYTWSEWQPAQNWDVCYQDIENVDADCTPKNQCLLHLPFRIMEIFIQEMLCIAFLNPSILQVK